MEIYEHIDYESMFKDVVRNDQEFLDTCLGDLASEVENSVYTFISNNNLNLSINKKMCSISDIYILFSFRKQHNESDCEIEEHTVNIGYNVLDRYFDNYEEE